MSPSPFVALNTKGDYRDQFGNRYESVPAQVRRESIIAVESVPSQKGGHAKIFLSSGKDFEVTESFDDVMTLITPR